MTVHSRLIVLVEDSAADVLLAQEALSDVLETHRLISFEDGAEAIDFLRNGPAEMPDLILLDLNLPRMDGRELLQAIKASDELRHIPVVILTTSSAPKDLQDAYAGHANSFVTKPVDLDDYARTLQDIVRYWFDTVSLPGGSQKNGTA